VSLNLPRGWQALGSIGVGEIPAKTEGRIRLAARAPQLVSRRLQVVGLVAEVDGQPRGEFAEAIVDMLA
jgi:hypothetical protein